MSGGPRAQRSVGHGPHGCCEVQPQRLLPVARDEIRTQLCRRSRHGEPHLLGLARQPRDPAWTPNRRDDRHLGTWGYLLRRPDLVAMHPHRHRLRVRTDDRLQPLDRPAAKRQLDLRERRRARLNARLGGGQQNPGRDDRDDRQQDGRNCNEPAERMPVPDQARVWPELQLTVAHVQTSEVSGRSLPCSLPMVPGETFTADGRRR